MLQTPYIKLWIAENILFCQYEDKINIDIHVAKHTVRSCLAFTKGKKIPTLINMSGVMSIDKQAREYLASEGSLSIEAGAFMTGSAYTKMLGSIFLTINKPQIPCKLFSEEKDAIQWLSSFRQIQ